MFVCLFSLVETERVLLEKAQKLTEQEHITTEHVQTEEQLATVASTLLTTVSTTVSDLEGLHSKLERKRKIEEMNLDSLRRFREDVFMKTGGMETQVSEFQEAQSQLFCDIMGAVKSFNETKTKDIGTSQQLLKEVVQQLETSLEATAAQFGQNLHAQAETSSSLASINSKLQGASQQETQDWKSSLLTNFASLNSQLGQHKDQVCNIPPR